ncbi:MAG: hypothetical protein H6Q74_3065 [Firmicutes bacterium]|nr:hypothetical protein [Bacillota bacterium]
MRNLGNIVLVIILLLMMNHQLLGSRPHEYLGVIFILFILLHLRAGWGCFKTSFRKKQSIEHSIGIYINLLLIAVVMATIITGLLISTTMVSIIQLRGYTTILAHELHQGSAYASFILIAIHLGWHWNSIWTHLERRLRFVTGKRYYQRAKYFITSTIIGYAVYASFVNHIGDWLVMEHMISLENGSIPLKHSIDLALIFAGYIAGACVCKRIIARGI